MRSGALSTEFDVASCRDYLHGDVADGEFAIACDYEYARESRVLCAVASGLAKLPGELAEPEWRAEFRKTMEKLEEEEAVRFRDIQEGNKVRPWDVEGNRGDVYAPLLEGEAHSPGLVSSIGELYEAISKNFSCGDLFLQSPWPEFFTCAQFPASPWNSLSPCDRRGILSTLPMPLGKGALRSVEVQKALALRTRLGSSGQHDVVAFLFDWAKGRKGLVRGFAAWLDRRENREALAKWSGARRKKTGGYVDRLKDLSAWRLFEHCGNDWNKANDFANKHRKLFEKPEVRVIGTGKNRKSVPFKKGDPKPFHDPRQGQDKHQLNEALLYSEGSGFWKAKSRAQAYLKERMPWEFFAEAEAAELEELRAQAQWAYEQLPDGWGEHEFAEMMQGLLQERE